MSAEQASILLIEDNQDIAEMVYAYLEKRGHTVDYAADGLTGMHLAVTQHHDVIILDLMLPGMDGVTLCRKLRTEAQRDTPVIMLTARDTIEERIAGLDAGADDYLVKPFDIGELEARVRSQIRRQRGQVAPETLSVADLTADLGTMEVRRAGTRIELTPIAFKLLVVLMRAAPRIVSRRELERQVWGDVLPESDTLRSHLYTLRKAIDRPFDSNLLHTLPNVGYRLAQIDE